MEITIKAPDGYTVKITVTDTPPDAIETKRRELATLAYQQAAKQGERN